MIYNATLTQIKGHEEIIELYGAELRAQLQYSGAIVVWINGLNSTPGTWLEFFFPLSCREGRTVYYSKCEVIARGSRLQGEVFKEMRNECMES